MKQNEIKTKYRMYDKIARASTPWGIPTSNTTSGGV
jgi:hypothetical protein